MVTPTPSPNINFQSLEVASGESFPGRQPGLITIGQWERTGQGRRVADTWERELVALSTGPRRPCKLALERKEMAKVTSGLTVITGHNRGERGLI